jgi:Tfp pilus assembly protein PilW
VLGDSPDFIIKNFMADFNKYKHLLVEGEYAKRYRILSGLNLKDVVFLPAAGMHSIYDELWHTTKWQNIVVNNDQELNKEFEKGKVYPSASPTTQEEWDNLVKEFLDGLNIAMDLTKSDEKLKAEVDPGVTMGDCIDSLAVHTAYHLGKIVAIRQLMNLWPPEEN